jgi:hypothetical protein
MLKILLLISSFLFSTGSNACITSQNFVLIGPLLPAKAYEESVIAKVQLLVGNDHSGTVRVVEAIKGVEVGDQFEVEASSLCGALRRRWPSENGIQNQPPVDTYFIAGNWKNLQDKKIFIGDWRGNQKVEPWLPNATAK